MSDAGSPTNHAAGPSPSQPGTAGDDKHNQNHRRGGARKPWWWQRRHNNKNKDKDQNIRNEEGQEGKEAKEGKETEQCLAETSSDGRIEIIGGRHYRKNVVGDPIVDDPLFSGIPPTTSGTSSGAAGAAAEADGGVVAVNSSKPPRHGRRKPGPASKEGVTQPAESKLDVVPPAAEKTVAAESSGESKTEAKETKGANNQDKRGDKLADYTHFISLPIMASESMVSDESKGTSTSEPTFMMRYRQETYCRLRSIKTIDPSIVLPPARLHITLFMLTLDESKGEVERAAETLKRCEPLIKAAVDTSNIHLKMRGINTFADRNPKGVGVLFFTPEEVKSEQESESKSSGLLSGPTQAYRQCPTLSRIAAIIRDEFVKDGLLSKEEVVKQSLGSDPQGLDYNIIWHCTAMNMRFYGRRWNEDELAGATLELPLEKEKVDEDTTPDPVDTTVILEGENIQGKTNKKWRGRSGKIDARQIILDYARTDFGVQRVGAIHLSRRAPQKANLPQMGLADIAVAREVYAREKGAKDSSCKADEVPLKELPMMRVIKGYYMCEAQIAFP